MFKLAKKEYDEDRNDLITNVSVKKKLHPAIVEKDFWVCLVLAYLFSKSDWAKKLAFKGGTSLSKAYNLIQRFSEDIDLILDWRELGYKVNEPWEQRSNSQQLKFLKECNNRLFSYLKDNFSPHLKVV